MASVSFYFVPPALCIGAAVKSHNVYTLDQDTHLFMTELLGGQVLLVSGRVTEPGVCAVHVFDKEYSIKYDDAYLVLDFDIVGVDCEGWMHLNMMYQDGGSFNHLGRVMICRDKVRIDGENVETCRARTLQAKAALIFGGVSG